MPILNPVFNFPKELEEWAVDEGPRVPQGYNPWDYGGANAWKMRANYSADEELTDLGFGSALWAVSLDETWWNSVWSDIEFQHGKQIALEFWACFASIEARKSRHLALRGIANESWSDVEIAFNAGRMYAKEGECFYGYLYPERLAENIATIKKNLGEWLYKAIKSGDHGAIRKLSELVAGKEPPPSTDMSKDEKFLLLQAFLEFLKTHFRLPMREELESKIQKKGNFRKYLKSLGLNGLPTTEIQK